MRLALTLLLLCSTCFATRAQAPCSSAAHSQFDFWLGDWTVYHPEADTILGYNTITKTMQGCVIEEHWRGKTGFEGKSFNTYNASNDTWNQTWVDQAGNTYHFSGKLVGGNMVMNGETVRAGKPVLFQMSYHPQEDGRVRQVWRSSRDGGLTWNLVFEGMYVKK